MLNRNLNSPGSKGLSGSIKDTNTSAFYSSFFIATTYEEFSDIKALSYEILHNPFVIVPTNTSKYTSVKLLNKEFPDEIELIGIKTLTINSNEMMTILKIRNAANYPIVMNIENMWANVKTKYMDMVSLSGYETEKEVQKRNEKIHFQLSINSSNEVLANVTNRMQILGEHDQSNSIDDLYVKDGELGIERYHMMALQFKFSKS